MENKYRPSGKEYLYVNDKKMLKVNHQYIEYLKSLAIKNRDERCTMCLHNDIRKNVNEMINVYPKGLYIRPHMHPHKCETKIIIEGSLLILIHNEAGDIVDEFIMDRNDIFTFRLECGIIHTNIPLTDVVFHEVVEGPFVGKDDSIFPEWSPEPDDIDKVNEYLKRIKISDKYLD